MELEPRVVALETDVAALKSEIHTNLATREDVLKVNMALKEDVASVRLDLCGMRTEMHKAINALTWRMFGFAMVTLSGVYYIARNFP